MINELGGVTSEIVKLALDAALVRHQVIANNIANNQSPNYQVQNVKFEEYFKGLVLEYTDDKSKEAVLEQIKSIHPTIETADVNATGSHTVKLDQEMAKMMQNTVQYQSLLAGLNQLGAIKKLAINGGRG